MNKAINRKLQINFENVVEKGKGQCLVINTFPPRPKQLSLFFGGSGSCIVKEQFYFSVFQMENYCVFI